MFWRLGGQFGGGWGVVWCKPRVPPKIAKIRLRIIRVCRINGVLIRMGRLKSPYDPSLVLDKPTFHGKDGTIVADLRSLLIGELLLMQ